ncbi:snare-like protein [Gautieria morchelliformis]|nr:snare-like protein [Gautieria morchelliformis]
MTIFSLYIYDRHCNCIYYQDWHRVKRPKPAVEGNLLPAVSRSVAPQSSDSTAPQVSFGNPRNTLSSSSGVVVALGESNDTITSPTAISATPPQVPPQPSTQLPFDEEAKLVYGVILSLRNMVKKLSGREEQFVAYQTSAYKLHVYETLSGYKFVMLTDPQAESLRFILRQIYTGPFIEYVVRNPLADMDSQEHGIDNENFRNGTDRLLRGLSIFN